jgi:hypothetical protein
MIKSQIQSSYINPYPKPITEPHVLYLINGLIKCDKHTPNEEDKLKNNTQVYEDKLIIPFHDNILIYEFKKINIIKF